MLFEPRLRFNESVVMIIVVMLVVVVVVIDDIPWSLGW